MKISDNLKAAKALINERAKWIQKDYAVDGDGYSVEDIREGVCFCSLGAIKKVREETLEDSDYTPESNYLSRFTKAQTVADYNDTHTHPEVMAMWDKAIELAEKDEAK